MSAAMPAKGTNFVGLRRICQWEWTCVFTSSKGNSVRAMSVRAEDLQLGDDFSISVATRDCSVSVGNRNGRMRSRSSGAYEFWDSGRLIK